MKLKIKVTTSLLVGGYSGKIFIDRITARSPNGTPIVPASVIKGALRIELERILRAVNQPVCDASSPDSMCQDQEKLCPACILFGGLYSEGKLRFYDAKIEDQRWKEFFGKGGYSSRAGIGVSRKMGTVKEDFLYEKEITEPFAEIEFNAKVEVLQGLTQNEIKYFKAAVKALDAIGGEKTRGLGWIEATLENNVTAERTTPLSPALTLNTILAKMIPKEPIRISLTKTTAYFYETLDYIPGSAFRGAIAKSIGGSKGYNDSAFRDIFIKAPVIFTNSYPSGRDVTQRGLPKPIPLSARTCKTYPGFAIAIDKLKEDRSHGYKDVLITDLLARLFFEELGIRIPLKEKCEYCSSGLKEFSGYYISPVLPAEEPPRQIMTRIAINRKLNTTREGVLYSYEAIEPIFEKKTVQPIIFVGLIRMRRDSKNFKDALTKISEIELGGRRNVGFGKTTVRFEDFALDSTNEFQQRLESLNQRVGELGLDLLEVLGVEVPSLRNRFEKLNRGSLSESDEFYFAIALTSDLIPPQPDSKEFLEKTLGDKVVLKGCFINSHRVGGWNDDLKIQKDLSMAISKGSALAFSASSTDMNNLLAKVVNLSQSGIGLRTSEGFGQFSFCDELHYQKVFQK